ncbi:MAG: DUF2799 domain-containing protein [Chromatiales bacterium]|nr:DUF2799 domain-containing protein [Chromatiales bacterium]
MHRIGLLLGGLLALAQLAGCATLNEAECRSADWQAIGYEDGVAGRPATRLAAHRKACAKHDVQPDLAAYTAGRDAGLQRYCQPHSGYWAGLEGAAYHGVCPAPLRDAFLPAYAYGREIHVLEADARGEQGALDRLYREAQDLDERIAHHEALLIAPGLRPHERADILIEIKSLVRNQRAIEADMAYHAERVEALHYQAAELRARSPY